MDSRLHGESTPRLEQKGSGERHSHGSKVLVGSTPPIGLTYSGGMTEPSTPVVLPHKLWEQSAISGFNCQHECSISDR